jgi:hypothetical protein
MGKGAAAHGIYSGNAAARAAVFFAMKTRSCRMQKNCTSLQTAARAAVGTAGRNRGAVFFTFALQWVRARGQAGGSGVTIKMPGVITCRDGVQEGQGAYRFLLGRRRFPDRMTGLEEIP